MMAATTISLLTLLVLSGAVAPSAGVAARSQRTSGGRTPGRETERTLPILRKLLQSETTTTTPETPPEDFKTEKIALGVLGVLAAVAVAAAVQRELRDRRRQRTVDSYTTLRQADETRQEPDVFLRKEQPLPGYVPYQAEDMQAPQVFSLPSQQPAETFRPFTETAQVHRSQYEETTIDGTTPRETVKALRTENPGTQTENAAKNLISLTEHDHPENDQYEETTIDGTTPQQRTVMETLQEEPLRTETESGAEQLICLTEHDQPGDDKKTEIQQPDILQTESAEPITRDGKQQPEERTETESDMLRTESPAESENATADRTLQAVETQRTETETELRTEKVPD